MIFIDQILNTLQTKVNAACTTSLSTGCYIQSNEYILFHLMYPHSLLVWMVIHHCLFLWDWWDCNCRHYFCVGNDWNFPLYFGNNGLNGKKPLFTGNLLEKDIFCLFTSVGQRKNSESLWGIKPQTSDALLPSHRDSTVSEV